LWGKKRASQKQRALPDGDAAVAPAPKMEERAGAGARGKAGGLVRGAALAPCPREFKIDKPESFLGDVE